MGIVTVRSPSLTKRNHKTFFVENATFFPLQISGGCEVSVSIFSPLLYLRAQKLYFFESVYVFAWHLGFFKIVGLWEQLVARWKMRVEIGGERGDWRGS